MIHRYCWWRGACFFSINQALNPKKKKNLYDAAMDLMLVEQAEKNGACIKEGLELHIGRACGKQYPCIWQGCA